MMISNVEDILGLDTQAAIEALARLSKLYYYHDDGTPWTAMQVGMRTASWYDVDWTAGKRSGKWWAQIESHSKLNRPIAGYAEADDMGRAMVLAWLRWWFQL